MLQGKELYQIDRKYSDYPKIAADVISKDPGNWYSTFVVNRGTADGIAVDMNVLGQGGLVGIVTAVGEHWAEVRSIIDDCYKKARKIISDNQDVLFRCADLLIEKEKITHMYVCGESF